MNIVNAQPHAFRGPSLCPLDVGGARAPLNRAFRNVSINSHASADPITFPPRQNTFMSSSSTPWWAENTSWMSPARTPATLLAQMDAPTPLPQSATPRSTCPAATALASGMTNPGSRLQGSVRARRNPRPHGRNRAATQLPAPSDAKPPWSDAIPTRIMLSPSDGRARHEPVYRHSPQ